MEEDHNLRSLCQTSPVANKLILMEESSYDEVKPLCDVIGGRLPTPETGEETDSLMEEMLNATEGILPEELCHDSHRPFVMVVGLKYSDAKGTWINIYTNDTHPMVPIDYNRLIYKADCVVTAKSGVETSECDWQFGCGVCLMEKESYFHLKGMCKANIDKVKWYDYFYYIYGFYNLKPHFMYVIRSFLVENNNFISYHTVSYVV